MFARLNSDPNPPHWTQLYGINRRKAGPIVLALAVLGVAGWFAWPHFRQWQMDSLLTQAHAFRTRGDLASAVLTTREVLQRNTANLEASKLMAEMAEQAGSPEAAGWREHVAVLEPSVDNYIAWANSAMRLGQIVIADHALSKVPAAQRQTLEFTRAAATLALLRNQRALAEKLLSEIARREPSDANTQLNLASVRATSASTNSSADALKALEQLSTNPVVRLPALRTLVATSLKRGDTNRAVQLAAELARDARATLGDQLLHLSVLQQARHPDFGPKLKRLQKAVSMPEDIFIVTSWMSGSGMAAQAEAWIEAMPDSIRAVQPIPLALAETLVTQQDWNKLDAITRDAKWQEKEFMRLAMQARALRAKGDDLGSRKAWKQAAGEAQGNFRDLTVLARMANAWRWEAETEELWWRLANGAGDPWPAVQSLLRSYTTRGDTRQILRVCRRIREINPDDLVAKNNVVMLALLLHDDEAGVHQLARENYDADRDNPIFVSTYAFSLLQQKRPVEAEKIIRALPEKFLNTPSVAAYYGLILAANKETDQAARYLTLAGRSSKLLPEEKILITEAQKQLK